MKLQVIIQCPKCSQAWEHNVIGLEDRTVHVWPKGRTLIPLTFICPECSTRWIEELEIVMKQIPIEETNGSQVAA